MAVFLIVQGIPAHAAFWVTATRTELVFHFDSTSANRRLVELAPYEEPLRAASRFGADGAPRRPYLYEDHYGGASKASVVADADRKTVSVPRFDGDRDRIYSKFIALENGIPDGPARTHRCTACRDG